MYKIIKYMAPLIIAAKLGSCVALLEYNAMETRESSPMQENEIVKNWGSENDKELMDMFRKKPVYKAPNEK